MTMEQEPVGGPTATDQDDQVEPSDNGPRPEDGEQSLPQDPELEIVSEDDEGVQE